MFYTQDYVSKSHKFINCILIFYCKKRYCTCLYFKLCICISFFYEISYNFMLFFLGSSNYMQYYKRNQICIIKVCIVSFHYKFQNILIYCYCRSFVIGTSVTRLFIPLCNYIFIHLSVLQYLNSLNFF